MGHGPLAVSCELHWEQLRESFGTGRTSFQTSLLEGTRRILQRVKYFLNHNLSFLLLYSTFCLDTKGGAKKSRAAQLLRMPAQPTAQQSLRVRTIDSLRCSVFHFKRSLYCLVRTVFSLKGFVMRYLRRCLSGSYSLEMLQAW